MIDMMSLIDLKRYGKIHSLNLISALSFARHRCTPQDFFEEEFNF